MYKGQPYNCIHVICTKVLEQTKTRVLFTIKQKNNLPLTTLQTDKKMKLMIKKWPTFLMVISLVLHESLTEKLQKLKTCIYHI